MTYREFLENKIDIAPQSGIEVDPAEISPALKDHQRVCVLWALRGGRRGLFARFGLGKTVIYGRKPGRSGHAAQLWQQDLSRIYAKVQGCTV